MDASDDAMVLLSHAATLQQAMPARGCLEQCHTWMTVATVACALCGVLRIGEHVELQARRAFAAATHARGGPNVCVPPAPWWLGCTWLLVPMLCIYMR